jgi:hypothetical protein
MNRLKKFSKKRKATGNDQSRRPKCKKDTFVKKNLYNHGAGSAVQAEIISRPVPRQLLLNLFDICNTD